MAPSRPDTVGYDRTLSIYEAYADPASLDARPGVPSRARHLEDEQRAVVVESTMASFDVQDPRQASQRPLPLVPAPTPTGMSAIGQRSSPPDNEPPLSPTRSTRHFYPELGMQRPSDPSDPRPGDSLPPSRTTSHMSSEGPASRGQSTRPTLGPARRSTASSALTYPASQIRSPVASPGSSVSWRQDVDLEEGAGAGGSSSDQRTPVLGRNDSLGTMLSVGNGIEGDLERGYEGSNGTLRRVLPTRRPSTQLTGWRKFFPPSIPTRMFLALVVIETVVNLAIGSVLLYRVHSAAERTGTTALDLETSRTLPVYLCIFGLAHLFQLVLAFDATVNRNTIQIIGLSVFNALFLAYAVLQMSEIKQTIGRTYDGTPTTGETTRSILHVPVSVLTGGILGVIALAEAGFIVLSWFIFKEFGWDTYKNLGADRRIKRIHTQYQIFLCIIRFSAFFFVGYGIQLIFLVLQKTDAEYYITIAALPLSILLLIEGTLSARFEWFYGMLCFMLGLLAGCAYFSFKLYRIYQQKTTTYAHVYKSLTIFAVLSLAMLVLTSVWSIVVMLNFNKGLKFQLERKRQRRKAEKKALQAAGGSGVYRVEEDKPTHHEYEMEPKTSRMTID